MPRLGRRSTGRLSQARPAVGRRGGRRRWPRCRCGRRPAAPGDAEPASGSATPCGCRGLARVREALPSWRVSTASGSFAARNASHTWSPSATPYLLLGGQQRPARTAPRRRRRRRTGRRRRRRCAIRSVSLNGSWSPALVIASRCPVSTYSPGKLRPLSDCVDVGVDAGDVGLTSAQSLRAARAAGGAALSICACRSASVYGRVAPELCSSARLAGRAAGEGGQLAAADVAEAGPSATAGPARPRTRRRTSVPDAGGAGDVRHAGLLVAHDRHVGARAWWCSRPGRRARRTRRR